MENDIEVELVLAQHPLWQSLVEYPPDSVRYKVRLGKFAKIYYRLNNLFPLSQNLVHFCNGAKPLKTRPWIVDCESVKVFFKSYEDLHNPKEVERVERLLNQEVCRKIVPLSYASKSTLLKYLDLPEDKIEVVYPAVPTVVHDKEFKDRKDLNLLFVGGAFEAKGGREVVEAFKILSKSYPSLSLTVVGNVKDDNICKKIDNLKILTHVSRKELFRNYYSNADIFVMPSYMDTVGYVLLEAMSFGIPIVASKHFATPEIVKDAGILVDAPVTIWKPDRSYNYKFSNQLSERVFTEVVDELVGAIQNLIEDKDLREKLSNKARRIVERGHVSIKGRNEKLEMIYKDIINS